MTTPVIDRGEPVEIEMQQGEHPSVAFRPRDSLQTAIIKTDTIQQTAGSIGERQVLHA